MRACRAVTVGRYVQESEKEGETEEKIKDELVGFLVQKAYCKQRLGQSDLAEKDYEEALKLKPSDQEVAAVASNNLFALRGKDTSLFDSAKKARALNLDTAVEEKLTLQQRRIFAVNRCLLSLYTNKHKECLAALGKLEKELAGSELPSLVKAALMAREKRLDECSALLQQYATQNPKTALRVKLTLAQLQLQQGEKAAAIGTLESISGAFSHAGIVGAIVKLYDLIKDPTGAIKTLDAACAAMEGDKSKEAPALARRYRMLAADLRMSSQDSGEALKALLALVQGGDKEAFTVARLCTLLCAAKDVDQAEKYAGMLPSIAGTEDVDVQVGTGVGGREAGIDDERERRREGGKWERWRGRRRLCVYVHTMSARSISIYMIYLSIYAMCV
jgi:tetratricopeptide (TPR) repeat protein